MDADKILLAIEEKRKWEERVTHIEAELKKIADEKARLHEELKSVSSRARYYASLVDGYREYSVVKASGVYFQEGAGRFK